MAQVKSISAVAALRSAVFSRLASFFHDAILFKFILVTLMKDF